MPTSEHPSEWTVFLGKMEIVHGRSSPPRGIDGCCGHRIPGRRLAQPDTGKQMPEPQAERSAGPNPAGTGLDARGQIAVVTGAARGVGCAFSSRARGWNVRHHAKVVRFEMKGQPT